MRGFFSQRGDNGSGSCTRSDHQNAFARIVVIGLPQLGMDELALLIAQSARVPFGRDVRLLVIVIALSHPQEAACEGLTRAFSRAPCPHRPAFACTPKATDARTNVVTEHGGAGRIN